MQGRKLRRVFKRVCEKLKHVSEDDMYVILWSLKLSYLFHNDAPEFQLEVLRRKLEKTMTKLGEYRSNMITDMVDEVFDEYFQ